MSRKMGLPYYPEDEIEDLKGKNEELEEEVSSLESKLAIAVKALKEIDKSKLSLVEVRDTNDVLMELIGSHPGGEIARAALRELGVNNE